MPRRPRSSRRSRGRPTLVIVAAFLLVAVVLPASAAAVAVSVTGDNGKPRGIDPAAPPAIRTLRPVVGIAGDAGGGRYSVSVSDPAGKGAARPVICQDPARPSSLQLPFRGNGRYTVAVTTFAAGDVGCTLAIGPATSFGFTIAGRVVLGAVARFAMRDVGSSARKPLALAVDVDPGSQTREVRFAAHAKLHRDGSIRGRSSRASYKAGSARLLFPSPGTYTVVARDSADGLATPWSEPIRIQVVTPFDLTSLRFTDTSGPVFRLLAHAPAGVTGVVHIALARGGHGAFRGLGRARIDAEGAFGARFNATTAGRYRLRFGYGGNGLVTRGEIVRSLRIGTAIVGGG
jgi:hypothetical protein